MSVFLSQSNEFIQQHGFLLLMSATVILAMAGSWFVSILTARLVPKLSKTPFFWDEPLVHSFYAPAITLIWLLSIIFVFSLVLRQLGLHHFSLFDENKLQQFSFILVLFWFLIRYIRHVENHLVNKPLTNQRILNNKTNVRATAQVSRTLIFVVFGLSLMKSLGIEINTLLAFGGVGGLAVSFAARDSLANFFGGLMIYWDRPFTEGDWVKSPDRKIEGTVEKIGWRLTRIRSFDKRPMYVPNGVFSNIVLENPQRMTNRRIKTIIGLRYEDASKIKVVLEDIEKMLRQHPEIDQNQTLIVNLVEFGASALNIMVYTFTKTTQWVRFQAIQQDVFLQIIGIINAHGAECAYPTTTLHIQEGLDLIPTEEQ